MSSVVIAGDTSGAITLQAPAVAGTTTLTLPAVSGTVMAPATAGTSGQLLTSAGTGAAPTWSTPAAGAMTFLESVTAASSATVELTALTSTYDMYMVVGSNVVPSVNFESLRLRVMVGGTTQTTGYKGNTAYTQSGSSSAIGNEGADTAYLLINRGQVSTNGSNFVLYIGTPANATLYKAITWQTFGTTTSPTSIYQFGGGAYMGGTGAITRLNFATLTGNLASGTFRLYGISNS